MLGMVWSGGEGDVVCAVVWCGVVRRGAVWPGVAWCGIVWCDVVWRGVVWQGVVWCRVAWCGVTGRGVVWRGVVYGVAWRCVDSSLPPCFLRTGGPAHVHGGVGGRGVDLLACLSLVLVFGASFGCNVY